MIRERIRGLFGQEEKIPEAMWDDVYRIEYKHSARKVVIFFEGIEGKETEEIDDIVTVAFHKCEPELLRLRSDVSAVGPQKNSYFSADKTGRVVHVWPEGH